MYKQNKSWHVSFPRTAFQKGELISQYIDLFATRDDHNAKQDRNKHGNREQVKTS